MSGKRTMSAEERELWDSVARQTRPLRKAKAKKASIDAAAKPADATQRPTSKPLAKASAAPALKAAVRPPLPPLVALGRRERGQIARGKKTIDARLDLHGMTQARAHAALLRFLQRASDDGHGFVLVITGKGRADDSAGARGVLRRQVPEWLSLPAFRACVLGFEEAHIGHGGGGALYVRVRSRR